MHFLFALIKSALSGINRQSFRNILVWNMDREEDNDDENGMWIIVSKRNGRPRATIT